MKRIFAIAAVGSALALGTAGAFYAGIAYAADPRLDQAIDNCNKAIALLEAATNEGAHKNDFHGHRKEAIKELKEAIAEINKAKTFDDKTPPPPAAPAASAMLPKK
jgi:hypothetical protein